jgi:WhiB family redox-sensing transcriptional regulator
MAARWQDHAACIGLDQDIFFPGSGDSTGPAEAICEGCPSRLDCLQYALDNGIEHGVWGGHNTKARKRLARRKQRAA